MATHTEACQGRSDTALIVPFLMPFTAAGFAYWPATTALLPAVWACWAISGRQKSQYVHIPARSGFCWSACFDDEMASCTAFERSRLWRVSWIPAAFASCFTCLLSLAL